MRPLPFPLHSLGSACYRVRPVDGMRKYPQATQPIGDGGLDGGEPGLVPALTHRLATAITEKGIAVRVETNAYWATSDEAARRFLEPLNARGASLMFSLDAWHEPYVPPERVARAAQISESLGGQYCLEAAYLEWPRCEHERDQRTETLLAALEKSVRPPSQGKQRNHPVQWAGCRTSGPVGRTGARRPHRHM